MNTTTRHYTFNRKPAKLIKKEMNPSSRYIVYWIEVSGQLIKTCILESRFRIKRRHFGPSRYCSPTGYSQVPAHFKKA